MKTEIIYATMTGHSKKIASAVAKLYGITAHNIKENPQISNCDLLYIVSGIYGGDCSPELLKFCKNLSSTQVKKVALITSSTGGFLFMAISHPNKDEINGAVTFAKKLIKE